MSRDNFYRNSPFVSDTGDRGHPVPEFRVSHLSSVPAVLAGAGGEDPYAGYDPGMAGCTSERGACSIPGMRWMGVCHPRTAQHPYLHTGTVAGSRGYERDGDEYDESDEPMTPVPTASCGPRAAQDSVVKPPTPVTKPEPPHKLMSELQPESGSNSVLAPAQASSEPRSEPESRRDRKPEAETAPSHSHSPSIGTRLVGRVERLAGRVLRDPDIEARGQRHMTGHL